MKTAYTNPGLKRKSKRRLWRIHQTEDKEQQGNERVRSFFSFGRSSGWIKIQMMHFKLNMRLSLSIFSSINGNLYQ
jgi:hypothetical protein